MPQGTYSNEAADASVADRLSDSLSKIGRALVPHAPAYEPASAGNKTAQQAADDATIGRMKQAQSTDRDNSYSY